MTTATMRKRKSETARRAAVEVIQPPVPTAAECGVCFWCSHQFEPCDLPKTGKDYYGKPTTEYEGQKGTVTERNRWGSLVSRETIVHDHDRLDVPFLPGVYVCRDCLDKSRETQNKIGTTDYAHPSIKAMDAAFAKRVREMGERVGGFYNPKTYCHPSLRKWDAAVKSGKIKLNLICRFSLLPGNSKLGKGGGKIGTVTVETMDEERAAAWKAEFAARQRRDQEYRDRLAAEAMAAAKASQLAAQAASVTIGAAA